MNKIAWIFNEEEVPSKLGGRWYASTVKRMLDPSEVYTAVCTNLDIAA
jgi:hypothetical protein